MKKIIEYIIESKIRYMAIVGLAKNAGKTVTLNTIVKEAVEQGLKLALLSYGRDGEEIDAITLKKKPRIYIPPSTIFVTAEKALGKSNIKAELLQRTGLKTLMGEVNIYRATGEGFIELVGINSGSSLDLIKNLLPENLDLVMVDGALDRRSSAMPDLTDGLVLATGAVVGNREELVVDRTITEIEKLTLPELRDPRMIKYSRQLFLKKSGGIINSKGQLIPLESSTSFGSIREIEKRLDQNSLTALILPGALIDSFVENLLYSLKLKDCSLIVQDGTRNFLNKRNLNLLKKFNVELKVLDSIELLAVTVNPYSPYGVYLDSEQLVEKIEGRIFPVPVFDLLSDEYQGRER